MDDEVMMVEEERWYRYSGSDTEGRKMYVHGGRSWDG